MRQAGHLLITSASRKAPLIRAAQDAVRRIQPGLCVIAGDADANTLARYIADDFWHMPPAGKTAPEDLLDACIRRGIRAVLPTRDGELLFWAQARERFAAAGVHVFISPPDSIARCVDKLAFARAGAALNLPVIPAAEQPDEAGGGPYAVKERYGAGALGIGLDLNRSAALAHARSLDKPVFQPFIAGPEISIDTWMDRDGAPRGVILRRRDLVIGGEAQITTTFRDPALEAETARIFSALELRGPAVMQAILADGRLHVIECNARFGGASTTAIAAGLDSLYWSLFEAFTPDAPAPRFQRIEGELRQVRLPADMILRGPDMTGA